MAIRMKSPAEKARIVAELADKMTAPKHPVRKRSQTMRLDEDVLAYFKAKGPGWSTMINAILRERMERGE